MACAQGAENIVQPSHSWMITGLIVLALLLPACRGQSDTPATPEFFVPPTLAATPVPSPLPTPTPQPPTPTAPCEDNLVFREDITIPDGTVVRPGARLDKRWRVQNAGSCNWDEGYRIKLVGGSELGAAPEQSLFPARSGTEVELQIEFTAPDEVGVFRSAWQAFNPQGEPFGDPFFIEIVVEEPTPTPEATENPAGT